MKASAWIPETVKSFGWSVDLEELLASLRTVLGGRWNGPCGDGYCSSISKMAVLARTQFRLLPTSTYTFFFQVSFEIGWEYGRRCVLDGCDYSCY